MVFLVLKIEICTCSFIQSTIYIDNWACKTKFKQFAITCEKITNLNIYIHKYAQIHVYTDALRSPGEGHMGNAIEGHGKGRIFFCTFLIYYFIKKLSSNLKSNKILKI